MGQIYPYGRVQLALAVIKVANLIMPPDGDSQNLYFGLFNDNDMTGLYLNDATSTRACTISGNRSVADQIDLYYGTLQDFDPKTHAPLGSAIRVVFNESQIYQAAEFLVKWLTHQQLHAPSANV